MRNLSMRPFNNILLLPVIIILVTLTFTEAEAQFREDVQNTNYTGSVINTDDRNSSNLGLSNLLQDFSMSHSYSMTFSSMGGNYQNINAYTNTMHLKFNEDLTGRVDLSLLHSPFGPSSAYQRPGTNQGLNSQIVVENAQLQYELSNNATLSFQFRQIPSSYNSFYGGGYGFGGSAFSPYHSGYSLGGGFHTNDNPFRD